MMAATLATMVSVIRVSLFYLYKSRLTKESPAGPVKSLQSIRPRLTR